MEGGGAPAAAALSAAPFQNVSWHMRGAWLLQTGAKVCGDPYQDPCRAETIHVLLLLIGLCTTIVLIICAFAFFREDKEEQITPLCPQLVVKESEQNFVLPLDSQKDSMVVQDLNGQPLCKVAMDWPDPFRPGASGVAATVRLQSNLDLTLATVVARNVAVVGQGLALCRAGCEIFGFVEFEGPGRFSVRHRTGVHLLTLKGDFASVDVEGINPVGSKVCWFKKDGDTCRGSALQHVDVGLVICSLLATHVHRRLAVDRNSAPGPAPTVRRGVPSPTTAQAADREREDNRERAAQGPATEAAGPAGPPAGRA